MAFGGLGRPGERVTGHMDRWSEFTAPILQTAVMAALAPILVILTFLNVFLIQPGGFVVLAYCVALFVEFVLLVGGTIPFTLPIFGKHEIKWAGTRTWQGIAVATIPFIVFWLVWSNFGYEWLETLWYKFWPAFSVLGLDVCVPCWRPPLWVTLFVVPSTFGAYYGMRLLGFRFGYEIPDPNWPPTIAERVPEDGHIRPGWVAGGHEPYQEESEDGNWMAQTKNGKNGCGSWAFYTPPKGVSHAMVRTVCWNISKNLSPDGKYLWPGEGHDGVSGRKHRAIQDDWVAKRLASQLPNNFVEITPEGIEVMKKILSEPPEK